MAVCGAGMNESSSCHLAFGCASESLARFLFLALKIFDSPGLRYMLCTLSLNSPENEAYSDSFCAVLDRLRPADFPQSIGFCVLQ
ncbi:hypothetical protein CY34DRAFT_803551 [Suillus luteus UH-Slu-Lm8-n1]|uniref:Uncharacterized protein n=1 Tax=Suillus luteus UH-Slu-Lm8-n1 TaxID=930992 RepID=A0A0D0APJ8_9AGAM|nr:hypothetical protein CY34DRAFT_803551 [Suillus luteus UH-Slu-Lm8-n1]